MFFVSFYLYKKFSSLWNANFSNPDSQSFYSTYLACFISEETNEALNWLLSACALLQVEPTFVADLFMETVLITKLLKHFNSDRVLIHKPRQIHKPL